MKVTQQRLELRESSMTIREGTESPLERQGCPQVGMVNGTMAAGGPEVQLRPLAVRWAWRLSPCRGPPSRVSLPRGSFVGSATGGSPRAPSRPPQLRWLWVMGLASPLCARRPPQCPRNCPLALHAPPLHAASELSRPSHSLSLITHRQRKS